MKNDLMELISNLVYLGLNALIIVESYSRVITLDSSVAITLVLLMNLSAIILLALVYFKGTYCQRLVIALLLACGNSVFYIYSVIVSQPFTVLAYEPLWHGKSNTLSIFSQYPIIVIMALFFAFLTLFSFFVYKKQPRRRLLSTKTFSLLFFAPIFIVTIILYTRQGYGDHNLSAIYRLPAHALVLTIEEGSRLLHKVRQVEPPAFTLNEQLGDRPNVVLIIDESISADYINLDHNDSRGLNLINSKYSQYLHSYGVAASGTNCSFGSNLILKMGLRPTSYKQEIDYHQTIWSLAKKAGYQTVFIDAQMGNGYGENRNNSNQFVDYSYMAEGVELIRADAWAATILKDQLDSAEQPKFIIVNKVGAHTPYQEKVPSDFKPFKPILNQNLYGMQDDKQYRIDAMDDNYWVRAKNSYKNAIIWNTAYFFDHVLTNRTMEESVFIYTSDHGQNFHDDGSEGYSTHCNRPAGNSEGRVPMMVITGHDHWRDKFQQAAITRQGSADHFQVYPTLLKLLGFSEQSVSNYYNSDLLNGEEQRGKFLQLFWTRFGTQPEWVNISKNDTVE